MEMAPALRPFTVLLPLGRMTSWLPADSGSGKGSWAELPLGWKES